MKKQKGSGDSAQSLGGLDGNISEELGLSLEGSRSWSKLAASSSVEGACDPWPAAISPKSTITRLTRAIYFRCDHPRHWGLFTSTASSGHGFKVRHYLTDASLKQQGMPWGWLQHVFMVQLPLCRNEESTAPSGWRSKKAAKSTCCRIALFTSRLQRPAVTSEVLMARIVVSGTHVY